MELDNFVECIDVNVELDNRQEKENSNDRRRRGEMVDKWRGEQ